VFEETNVTELLSYWFLQTVAMGLTALLIPRLRITGLLGAFKIVAALAFLNATVWDAALFFSIPDGVTSQALTLLLVNGVIFWLLVKLVGGMEVDGFLPALVAPVVFTVFSLLIAQYSSEVDWTRVYDLFSTFVADLRSDLSEVPLSDSKPPLHLEPPVAPAP
jgi:putative membrane protein